MENLPPYLLPLKRLIRSYHRLSHRTRALVLLALLLIGLVVFPASLNHTNLIHPHAATLYFVEPTGGQVVGQNFPVELHIKTNGTPVNAIGATIIYNPNHLEVASMTTETSPCSFYLDNSFDNIEGKVRISCGLPTPGFLGDSVVVRLTMRAKIPGDSSLTLDPKEAFTLADDGKGTNILSSVPSMDLNITQLL